MRFHGLGAQSLWNDEGNSYVQATRSLSDIAYYSALDIHPPGYYWLLSGWRLLTDDTEFALRALSAFASVLTVAFAFALGHRLYGGVAGIAAGLLVALNTFSIYYAQEARMYALLALWGAAAMWALVNYLSPPLRPSPSQWGGVGSGDWRSLLALALINAAGLWTQYAYPFVMIAQGAVFVVWWIGQSVGAKRKSASEALTPNPSPSWRGALSTLLAPFALREKGPGDEGQHGSRLLYYIAANLLTLLLYLPWLPNALRSVSTWPSTGQPTALNQALSVILGWFTLGITASVTDASWVAIGLFLLLFGLRGPYTWRSLWRVLLPATWAVLPVGLFLALGLYREGNLKLLLPAQIGFALWLGRGVWVLWNLPHPRLARLDSPSPSLWRGGWGVRLIRAAALVGLLGLAVNMGRGLQPLYEHPDFQRDDYRGIAAAIRAAERPGDAIILDAPNQAEVFRYYYDGETPIYPLPPGLGGDDAETQAAVEQIVADHARAFVLYWGDAERDPQRVVESTLGTQAFEAASQWYGDVRLVRYVMPQEPRIVRDSGAQFGDSITLERYALNTDHLTPGDALQVRLDWRTGAALDRRYKVFVQLLDSGGRLVAQHDGEPGGGLILTITWEPGQTVVDQHALIIPDDLSPAHYSLIVGLYDVNDPQTRLHVGDTDHLTLTNITVE